MVSLVVLCTVAHFISIVLDIHWDLSLTLLHILCMCYLFCVYGISCCQFKIMLVVLCVLYISDIQHLRGIVLIVLIILCVCVRYSVFMGVCRHQFILLIKFVQLTANRKYHMMDQCVIFSGQTLKVCLMSVCLSVCPSICLYVGRRCAS